MIFCYRGKRSRHHTNEGKQKTMFNTTTKKTAEQIKGELLPIVAIIEKLAKKTQQASSETSKAHKIATAWQYPTNYYYAEEAGENSKTIQETRENNPQEWHDILHSKYQILSEKETAEKLAKLNYHNYLLYFCNMVNYLLRVGNTWAQFYEKKGIETLSEYLRETLKVRFYISRDGTGFDAFGSSNFYCYFNITIYGVSCISGNYWGSYRELDEETQAANVTRPQAPKIYTLKQYLKIVKELTTMEQAAKNLAKEHYDKAQKTGLIYFIGGLETPSAKVWKMRD